MPTDNYKTLGVNHTASFSEIKDKYRELAKKHHPDLNPDNPTARGEMQAINEAYSILSDVKARALYNIIYLKYYKDNNDNAGFAQQTNDQGVNSTPSTFWDQNIEDIEKQLNEWILNEKNKNKKNKKRISYRIANFMIIPYVILTLSMVMNIINYPDIKNLAGLKSGYLWSMWGAVLLLYIIQLKLKKRLHAWLAITVLSFSTSVFLYISLKDAGPFFTINIFFTIPAIYVLLREKKHSF